MAPASSGSTSVRHRSSARRPARSSQRTRPRAGVSGSTKARGVASRGASQRPEPPGETSEQRLAQSGGKRRRHHRFGREEGGGQRHDGPRRLRHVNEERRVDLLALQHPAEVQPLDEGEHQPVLEGRVQGQVHQQVLGGRSAGAAVRCPGRERAHSASASMGNRPGHELTLRCSSTRPPEPGSVNAQAWSPRANSVSPASSSTVTASGQRSRASTSTSDIGRSDSTSYTVSARSAPLRGRARIPRFSRSPSTRPARAICPSVRTRVPRRASARPAARGAAQEDGSASAARSRRPARPWARASAATSSGVTPGGSGGKEPPTRSAWRTPRAAFDSAIGRA